MPRRKHASLLLGIFALALPLLRPGLALALPPVPVAAYAFDEGSGTAITDASGHNNNGTIGNATRTTQGKYAGALVFNGTNALVTISNAASLQLTTAVTLEAWVHPSTVANAWRDAVYKGDDNYILEATSDRNGGAPAGGITVSGPTAVTAAPTALPTNAWTHLAMTYDGTTLILYENGVQVSSLAMTGAIATSTHPLTLGGDNIYGQYFHGMLDEVRVYGVALTAGQIQTDMNTPVSNIPTAPGNLTATVVGTSQVDLQWTASTSSLGITNYHVERCQGPGCATFAEVASPTATSYSDLGLTTNMNYRYRVRAMDTQGHLGVYSDIAEAFLGLSISPSVAALTFSRTQQFTTNQSGVTWLIDGVIGGAVASGTITAGGLYTPPSTVGTHIVTVRTADLSLSANAQVYVTNYLGTFTHHNDNLRTGRNLGETVLNPTTVNSAVFGKLFTYPVDGLSFASPLYVANVSIPGQGFHNVVYAATEHNSVYAFDADGLAGSPLWHVSFLGPGVTTVPCADVAECGDIPNEIGITSTPVIDPVSATMYVVAKTKEGMGNYVQRLHALDIATGAEKLGGPVVLAASVPGTGVGSQGGTLDFLPLRENQRPALLLNNGVIYIAFASHGDAQPYHGWILGYDATTLVQTFGFCVTPNNEGAGVWQSGGGLAADAAGNVYFATGDGTFTADVGGIDYGDSFVKLSSTGVVVDYFTPYDQLILDTENLDLCAGGVILLPDQPGAHPHLLIGSGKNATVYLVDRDNMGHFHAGNDSHAVQTLPDIFPNGTPEPGNYSNPVYFDGTIYFSPVFDNIQAFQLNNGMLPTAPTSRSSELFTMPGATLAISADGSANGILWAVQRNGDAAPGALYAYDPGNLSSVFYNSNQAGTRDILDIAQKYTVPLVANGKVFVLTATTLTAFGGIAPVAGVPGASGDRPLALSLAPPAPNPMRDGANLELTLPRAEEISLEIVDVQGRLVRSVSRGTLSAGPYRFRWDGRDQAGQSVSSGLYFVRLGLPHRQLVRRLAVIR